MEQNLIVEMTEKYGDLFLEQLRLEDHFTQLAKDKVSEGFDYAKKTGTSAETQVGKSLLTFGYEEARKAVSEWYFDLIKPKKGVRPAYLSIIKHMQEVFQVDEKELEEGQEDTIDHERVLDVLSSIPMTELVNNIQNPDGIVLNNVAQLVAVEMFDEVRIEAYIKTIPPFVQKSLFGGLKTRVSRHYKVFYANNMMVKTGFVLEEWSKDLSCALSHQLLDITCKGSGFFEVYENSSKSREKGIKDSPPQAMPTQWLLDAWQKGKDKLIDRTHRNAPMVIPPLPWNGLFDGGYYGSRHGKNSFLRSESLRGEGSTNVFSKAYLKRFEESDISAVKRAINTIQETPWKINKKVYDVVESIMAKGGIMGGIPRLEPIEKRARLADDCTPEELKAHKKLMFLDYQKDNTRRSVANRAISHFKVAREYLKFEKIYFPYNMDFRGRVYPISAFSPQSDDLNKGLLEFADSPPCQDIKDMDWLMIHGANVAGVDKCSFEDRIKWVKDNNERILKSAEDPMNYRWWETVDSTSFQFLAFCFEWAKFTEYLKVKGNCLGYVCNLPIAFDGTCSGLQHYSAILRDPIGGASVNLIPDSVPHDIYRVVSDKVTIMCEKDAQNGTPDEEVVYNKGKEDERTGLKYGTKTLAQQWLSFGITRSVTKAPCMTLAYGSKQFGFKMQILKETIDPAQQNGLGKEFIDKNQASAYMAKKIWDSVQTTVVKAMEGMEYLQKLSRAVCKDGNMVTWTTPMGLPIQQAYMVTESTLTRLRLVGSIRRNMFINKSTFNIDKQAQVSGIAPNFIHSMDACHLQMTVLRANDAGIKHFALIHDSFGCPMSQAGILFNAIRESFLDLYSNNDVLQDFTDELIFQVGEDEELPVLPEKGSLNLDLVLQSQYMFA